MGRFKGADQALRWYLQAHERARAPRGRRTSEIEGEIKAIQCPGCKRLGRWRDQDGVERCQNWIAKGKGGRHCGTKRPSEHAVVLPGFIDPTLRRRRPDEMRPPKRQPHGRPSEPEELQDVAELGRLFSNVLTQAEWRCWQAMVLYPGEKHEAATAACREHFPVPERWWPGRSLTNWELRQWVKSARRKVEKGLVRLGYMDKEDLAA